MASSTMLIPGMELESIREQDGCLTIGISRVYLIKHMPGAEQDTRWKQAAELVINGGDVEGELPSCPCVISGGDIHDNVYTYRDLVPLPLKGTGQVGCTLAVEGDAGRFTIMGEAFELRLIGDPRYIEHVDPNAF